MMKTSIILIALICAVVGLAPLALAQTRTLRIVTYNIEDDTDGATSPLPGLIAPPSNPTNVQAGGVLEGIGEENVGNDPAQPLDILALEETTSNTQTIAPIVNGLNSFYTAPPFVTLPPAAGLIKPGNGAVLPSVSSSML